MECEWRANLKPVKGLPAAGVALELEAGAEAVEVVAWPLVVVAPLLALVVPPVLLPGLRWT